jgi:hypothetical protein
MNLKHFLCFAVYKRSLGRWYSELHLRVIVLVFDDIEISNKILIYIYIRHEFISMVLSVLVL